MPNCFALKRKSEPEKGNVSLTKIDEEICNLLHREVHDKIWCCNWYNIIGFDLAMGKTFAQIRQGLIDKPYPECNEEYKKIVDYLDENFVVDSWVEIGRR